MARPFFVPGRRERGSAFNPRAQSGMTVPQGVEAAVGRAEARDGEGGVGVTLGTRHYLYRGVTEC